MPKKLFGKIVLAGNILLLSAAVAAQDIGLPDLMSLLSQRKSSHATFAEKKFFKVLDRPVESSGELEYVAPNLVKKQTLTPKPELLILDGDKLSIESSGKRRKTFNLQDHPEVATFVTSIRATLAGDQAALENYYAVSVTGSLAQWQLLLIPKQAQLLKIINQIRISGSQGFVATIAFEQADGDRSEMTITGDDGK
jgi:outer membrane lipoprotein-sorting protein